MGRPVVHFEVIGRDGQKLQDFYSGLFDWKIDADNPMNYGIVSADDNGGGIGGGVAEGDQLHGVRFYVEVDDVDAYLQKAEQRGGKMVMPKTEIPNMVTFAVVSDPDGNEVGLVQAVEGQA